MGASYRTCIIIVTIHLMSSITAQELDKRGPQGFLGMRGKKPASNDLFKRRPQFFVGVKGKRTYYDALDGSEYFYKRAPMGFMGMRGKKDAADRYYPGSYEDLPRKGSLIGQIDYTSNENNNADLSFLNEILDDYLRRAQTPKSTSAPEMTEPEAAGRITNEIAKRAPGVHQFFGVRGKKEFQKRLSDVSFRGKFIGVRGKKDLKNSGLQEIKFLLDNAPPKRKGQMGFIGMRGKKWLDTAEESSSEPETPNTENEFQSLLSIFK